jgi:DNA-binding transcriptional LysR family regulator
MIAVRISPDMEMAVVGTPNIFAATAFQTPADLVAHPCIAISSATAAFTPGNLMDGKKITHPPQGQWAFADSYMEAKAARLGLGLAYVPEELITDDQPSGHTYPGAPAL